MSHIDILWSEQFTTETTNFDWVVMVDFWAEWCGPCRMLWPVLHQLTDEYAWKVKLLKIDVDAAENQQLAVQFGISSIPRVIFFVWGNKVDDFVWVQWPDAVKEFIEKHLPKWEAKVTETPASDDIAA